MMSFSDTLVCASCGVISDTQLCWHDLSRQSALVNEWLICVPAVRILAAVSRLRSNGTWCRMHESTASAASHCSASLMAADDGLTRFVGWSSTRTFTPGYVLTPARRRAAAGHSLRPVNFSGICYGTLDNASGSVHMKAVEKLLREWSTSMATCQHIVISGHIFAAYQVSFSTYSVMQ